MGIEKWKGLVGNVERACPVIDQEAEMRRTTAVAQTSHGPQIPRGWIVLGAALASWMVVAVLWTGTSQLFSYVASAI